MQKRAIQILQVIIPRDAKGSNVKLGQWQRRQESKLGLLGKEGEGEGEGPRKEKMFVKGLELGLGSPLLKQNDTIF